MDARLVFQLVNRSGEINGVWQRRTHSLKDRQSLFIENSALLLQLHDCARNATSVSTLLEVRAQQSAQSSIIRLRRSKKIGRR